MSLSIEADNCLLRSRLKRHLRLVDGEVRESPEFHRDFNLRNQEAGDLFGIRATEAGYFGGVAQSANNSPDLTPRGSVGDSSQMFFGPQYARSTSSSSALDLIKNGRISAADSYNNFLSTTRQTSLKPPTSPTTSSIAYAARKSPSPTKSPPISPTSSPIQMPSMAHVRQIEPQPSSAEWTGRHCHSPSADSRFEPVHETMAHPDIMTPPQSPPPQHSKRHARVFSASDMTTVFDSNKVPQLLLPAFIGSSENFIPEFDRSRSNRTSGISINTISAKRKSIDDEALSGPKLKRASTMNKFNTPARSECGSSSVSPEDDSIAGISTPLMNNHSTEKLSRREAIIPERFLELPAFTEGPRAPIPSVIVEGGRFYFDYSSTYKHLVGERRLIDD